MTRLATMFAPSFRQNVLNENLLETRPTTNVTKALAAHEGTHLLRASEQLGCWSDINGYHLFICFRNPKKHAEKFEIWKKKNSGKQFKSNSSWKSSSASFGGWPKKIGFLRFSTYILEVWDQVFYIRKPVCFFAETNDEGFQFRFSLQASLGWGEVVLLFFYWIYNGFTTFTAWGYVPSKTCGLTKINGDISKLSGGWLSR